MYFNSPRATLSRTLVATHPVDLPGCDLDSSISAGMRRRNSESILGCCCLDVHFPDLHGLIPPLTGCCIYSAVNSDRNTKNAGNNS